MKNCFFKYKKNNFLGERCFVIASGPSLKNEDLCVLKNEITIGVNQSYLITKKFGFDPTFICLADDFLYPKIKNIYEKLNSRVCFTTGKNGKIGFDYEGNNLIGLIKTKNESVFGGNFSCDIINGIYFSHNVVTDIAIPMVMYLGFKEIYLLGCDCRKNGYAYSLEEDIGLGQKFGDEVFYAYKSIKKYAIDNGYKIINLSEGSKLMEFETESLKNIIKKNRKSIVLQVMKRD